MKAMIFAAGLGTRLRPLTNDIPKALVKQAGEPMLKRVILKLKKAGINEFVINIHHFGEKVLKYLEENNNFDCKIEISDETDFLLDTGGALKKAASLLKDSENILLYNVDIFSDIRIKDFIRCHKKHKALVSLAVQNRKSDRRLIFNDDNFLSAWENTKTGEQKISREISSEHKSQAFSGIHVVSNKIFDLIEEEGKFSIIDLYLRLAKNHDIFAYNHDHAYFYDLGKIEMLKESEKHFTIK